jgi:hypothetical protein
LNPCSASCIDIASTISVFEAPCMHSPRFSEIWTASLALTFLVEYRLALRRQTAPQVRGPALLPPSWLAAAGDMEGLFGGHALHRVLDRPSPVDRAAPPCCSARRYRRMFNIGRLQGSANCEIAAFQARRTPWLLIAKSRLRNERSPVAFKRC